VADQRLTVVRVPGAFELPLVAQRLAESGLYAAVVCLGAVIQGETDHDKYINHAVSQGIMRAAQSTGVPVLFGVLTCPTLQLALDRAGGKAGNKGSEAAQAAIEMANVLNTL
jgi:6,7-dimethyl-8-ribityllumazine synthase